MKRFTATIFANDEEIKLFKTDDICNCSNNIIEKHQEMVKKIAEYCNKIIENEYVGYRRTPHIEDEVCYEDVNIGKCEIQKFVDIYRNCNIREEPDEEPMEEALREIDCKCEERYIKDLKSQLGQAIYKIPNDKTCYITLFTSHKCRYELGVSAFMW